MEILKFYINYKGNSRLLRERFAHKEKLGTFYAPKTKHEGAAISDQA